MNDPLPPQIDALASAPDPFAPAACRACGAALPPTGGFCEACGAGQGVEIDEAALYATPIAEARKWIAITGGLYVLGGLLMFAILSSRGGNSLDAGVTLVLNLVIAGIHGGLWVWAGRAPLAASIVAAAIFAMVHLTNAVLDPTTIFQGIFVKVFFAIALWKGIHAGLEVRKLELARGRRT